MDKDAFQLNIDGVKDLIESGVNKTANSTADDVGEFTDALTLPMKDDELIILKDKWEQNHNQYYPKVKARQDKNKLYYPGRQKQNANQTDTVVPSNLIFEAEETFIPEALSKNPEPVVWSDNTTEGKEESNQIKTMLQYHADVLCLRKKLAVMVRNWDTYFIAVLKHGWDDKNKEIVTDLRKPQNFVWCDPEAYIDEFGNYCGNGLGERITVTGERLIELFPEHKALIIVKCDNKLGTNITYTEWWTDEYCFSTFHDIVLDKHKNEYFNYDTNEETENDYGEKVKSVMQGENHFASPRMPYTFLSVFSRQEQPHDITSLTEQNIPNQDDINDTDALVKKNISISNNSMAVSGLSFNIETARQAAQAVEDGDPIIVPDGNMDSIKRLPASPLPNGLLQNLQVKKDTLRSIFGTQGLTAQQPNEESTARGMILNQSHDSTRIGGGIGDALEQVADNVFNWWLQLYYVFYDEPHYGAIMGTGRAIEYVTLMRANMQRKFVVSVAPNSMKPKDEISERNEAIELANTGWLDPLTLFKKLDFADPQETAKQVTMWKINPQLYFATFFPQEHQQGQMMGGQTENPPDMNNQGGSPPPSLGAPPASSDLSQVPLSTNAMPK